MRTDEGQPNAVSPSPANRRNSPRLEVVAAIQGQIRPDNVPITLLNVSRGGFLMRSPVPYAVDDVNKFRFTIPGEPPLVVRGRIAHVTSAATTGAAGHIIGVEFMDMEVQGCQQAIRLLLRAAVRQA